MRFKVLTSYRSDYSTPKGGLPNNRDFPGHVGPWKSIEGVQQIHKELGMGQAAYAPVFKGPDWATFTAGMRARMLPSTLYLVWEGLAMLSPVVTHDIYDLGHPLLIWGKLTNPRNGCRLGERPEMEKRLRKPKGLS